MCHVSLVTCHVSGVKCHVSQFFGGPSRWRVCYQQGLPRLFFFIYINGHSFTFTSQESLQIPVTQLHGGGLCCVTKPLQLQLQSCLCDPLNTQFLGFNTISSVLKLKSLISVSYLKFYYGHVLLKIIVFILKAAMAACCSFQYH